MFVLPGTKRKRLVVDKDYVEKKLSKTLIDKIRRHRIIKIFNLAFLFFFALTFFGLSLTIKIKLDPDYIGRVLWTLYYPMDEIS